MKMKFLNSRPLIICVTLLVLSTVAFAADKVYNFKGGVKTRADKGLTEKDIAPKEEGGTFYTSTYTFMYYLDNDASGMVQFTFWKMPFMGRHGIAFSFIDENGKQQLRKPVFDEDDFTYTASPRKFQLGKNYWAGDYPDFRIHMDLPEEDGKPPMIIDFKYKCRTPGWRPGEGPVHYGSPDGKWYDLVAFIPWADVTMEITIDGKKSTFEGYGYADHNTQTVLPTTQLGQILALRSFSEGYSIHFLEYIAPENYGKTRSTWIIIMKGNRILFATDKWEHEIPEYITEKKYGYKYPGKMEISIDHPDCKLEGTAKGVRFNEMIDAMEELPSFVRPIADKFFDAPVFIRQNAQVQWHLVMPKEGIDEKFINKGILETAIVR
jgi:Svf1-like C-terminal lipocalin-like domain